MEHKFFFEKHENLPLVTPFVDKKTNIDCLTLYSIHKAFELLHADIADLRFLAKSVVDLKYCLLIVDLFTSKIYVFPIKNRSLLAKKIALFWYSDDIQQKRTGLMRLQIDLEFSQNKKKEVKKKIWHGNVSYTT